MKAIKHKATGKYVVWSSELQIFEFVDKPYRTFLSGVSGREAIQAIYSFDKQLSVDDLEMVSVMVIEAKPVTEEVIRNMNPYPKHMTSHLIYVDGFRAACEYFGMPITKEDGK